MIYFKITQTGPDHTGQIDIIENIVSQFDLQEHLTNAKGVVNVEKVEQKSFCLYIFILKDLPDIDLREFSDKNLAYNFEKKLIQDKKIYKKYILQDKL